MKQAEAFSERMHLRVTKRQWLRFQALAFSWDVPISDLVRKAMDDFIAQMEGALGAEEPQAK